MRETFHAELDTLIGDLAGIVRLVGQMMTDASTALHEADLRLAERVISGADEMKDLCDDTDRCCLDLLVVQAPAVATELRVLVAAMRVVGDLKRMCNLAQHIATIARLKHPVVSIPAGVRPLSERMGVLAASLAQDAAAAMESRDSMSGDRLGQVDALRCRIFGVLFCEDWSHGRVVEVAVTKCHLARGGIPTLWRPTRGTGR